MADLRVTFQGLEADAEKVLRDNLIEWLRNLGDHVAHADFQGSSNGAPNFATPDVKADPSGETAPADTASSGTGEGEPTAPAGVEGGPPIPVATGIDPATLGAPAQSPA